MPSGHLRELVQLPHQRPERIGNTSIMKKILFALLTFLAFPVFSQTTWPAKEGYAGTVQSLAGQPNLPSHDLTVGRALNPSLPAEPVLVFDKTDRLQLRTNPGLNGTFELSIAHLAGGAFAPMKVYIGDDYLGQTRKVKGEARPVVSRFKTPPLLSGNLALRLKPKTAGTIGLIYIDWENLAFEEVPSRVWKTAVLNNQHDYAAPLSAETKGAVGIPETLDGQECSWRPAGGKRVDLSYGKTGTAVAVTHLYRATNWVNLNVQLQAEGPAVLSVNGQEAARLEKGDHETSAIVKWTSLQSGLNRLVVRMPAGNQAKFNLKINPRAGQFLDAVPDVINPYLNVDNWPRAEISNGNVTATVALPDPKKGFYRGPRFDHASMIPNLTFKGHSFFGVNAGPVRNPVANDQCAGPAEEFYEPLGFEEARAGQSFIKIGVGLLRKPQATNYFHGTAYWPVQFFDWQSEVGKNQVQFKQQVNEGAWGYEYTKTLSLPEGTNRMEIRYSLKNTGKKRIVTNQYAHNFIRIDEQPVGAAYTVQFKNRVSPVRPLPKSVIFSKRNTFTMGKKTMFTPLRGFKSVPDNEVRVMLADKTGVKITGDFTPFRYWFFASDKVVCPEPFIHIDLGPGQSKTWTRTYEFDAARHK
jgi:hypothetical protein